MVLALNMNHARTYVRTCVEPSLRDNENVKYMPSVADMPSVAVDLIFVSGAHIVVVGPPLARLELFFLLIFVIFGDFYRLTTEK